MSTFAQLQTRIRSDYLNRASDYVDETKRAIQAAIRHYENERWKFNQTATSLVTSSSQSFVTFPSNLLLFDDIRITVSGEDLPLNRRDAQTIRDWNTASTFNQPTDYAIYQNRAEFFPVPNSAWSIPIYYLKSLTELSADADTNAWTEGVMQDVIVYHAATDLWAFVLRNDKEAAKFAAREKTALLRAEGLRDQFVSHKLKSTSF